MVKGDIQRSIEGAYHFSPTADGGTEVRYDLAIELAAPLPGFVKRRAEVRILNTVRELKRAEPEARDRELHRPPSASTSAAPSASAW